MSRYRKNVLKTPNLPILIDMDGIFVDFLTGLYQDIFKDNPGLFVRLPSIKNLETFYVDDSIVDPRDKHDVKLAVNKHELFRYMPAYEGRVEGIKNLRKLANENNYEVMICTAPHAANISCYTDKARWIKENFGTAWLDNLILARDKSACLGTVLIDDKPDPSGAFPATWEHIVFDHSYNHKSKAKLRIFDFSDKTNQEIMKFVLQKDGMSNYSFEKDWLPQQLQFKK